MDKFVTSVKRKYRERIINRERQWPPCQSNKLVRLTLVEGVNEEGYYHASGIRGKSDKNVKRKPLSYGDLFKVESGERPVKKILVEGDAGIGKTTLSIAVSEDWVTEKLFQQFELLLLIPLRHRKIASASSLPELLRFLHSSQKLCNEVAECLEEDEGSNVLIIADGWDELAESSQSEGSFLYELLFEDLLPFASVIVTSRPSASIKFHRLSCIDRFLEITGFNDENITEYIESEFPNDWGKAARLREHLRQNTFVESMCIVPLNCAIVCHLWRTLEEALPTTMTELYTKIICNIILRNIQKNGFENVISLPNFDALPDGLKPSWRLLCELAFQTIERDQLTFTQQELAHNLPAFDEKILYFGLLQPSHSILEDGCGVSLHFLHLTIQEYLAALHLVKQLPDKDAANTTLPITMIGIKGFGKPCIRSLIIPDRYHIVWRFLFGIFFNVVKRSDCRIVQQHLECTGNNLVLFHCAFEARNEQFDSQVTNTLKAKKSTDMNSSCAYDSDAIIYVIDKTKEYHDDLSISLENCNLREDQVRRLADALANKDGKLTIKFLTLPGNKLTETSVYSLLVRASDALQSLRYLDLNNNRIGADKDKEFFPPKSSLEKVEWLSLSDNPLGVHGVQKLQSAIGGGSFKNLYQLELNNCLTDNADVNASLLESLLEELISARCPLTRLSLSKNNLGVPGASTLARMISKHNKIMSGQQKWLNKLSIDETNLGDAGLCIFIRMLKGPHEFESFSLRGNDLHASGIQSLVDAVCSGNIKRLSGNLYLPNTALGLEGTVAIAKLFSSDHTYFRKANLSRCQLTTTIVTSSNHPDALSYESIGELLCQMSPSQERSSLSFYGPLKELDLDENNFSGNHIHILAGFMCLCPSLRKLSSKNCALTSDDLIILLDKLKQFQHSSSYVCSQLCAWTLHNNQIDDNGIIALMQCQLFPQMEGANCRSDVHYVPHSLTLSANPISGEMVKMLDQEWRKRSRVRHQSLYDAACEALLAVL